MSIGPIHGIGAVPSVSRASVATLLLSLILSPGLRFFLFADRTLHKLHVLEFR